MKKTTTPATPPKPIQPTAPTAPAAASSEVKTDAADPTAAATTAGPIPAGSSVEIVHGSAVIVPPDPEGVSGNLPIVNGVPRSESVIPPEETVPPQAGSLPPPVDLGGDFDDEDDSRKLFTPLVAERLKKLVAEQRVTAERDLRTGPGGSGWPYNESKRPEVEQWAAFVRFVSESLDQIPAA